MRKLFYCLLLILILSPVVFSQRVLIDEDFETSGFTGPDSLPTNWYAFDYDNSNPSYPNAVWRVRDTSASFPGVNASLHSRARLSTRSVSIPWRAGGDIANDFLFMDSVTIQTGDSLLFWMLFGSPDSSLVGGITFSPYFDTMQVGYGIAPEPTLWTQLGPTLRSQDTNNIWTQYKYDLSSLAGQTIYLGFRYWMNTSVDGLWCNIDDIFVGNRNPIGIQPIGNTVPKKFELKQNYPNPFNPVTNIEFSIPKSGFVNLVIFNSLGQEVATLVNQDLVLGSYRYDFDASGLPSGTYFYRLTAGDFVQTNKMILVK